MATRERFRKRFMFWLNINSPRDIEVARLITDLKDKNLFTKTLRDGIKLICSLREGRVDLLLKMFPFVAQYFQSQLHAQQQQQYEAMQNQTKLMQDQIAYLKGLIESRAVAGNGGSSLPALPAPKPVDDSPIDIEVRDAKGKGSSSQNFKDTFLKYYGNSQ